MLFHGHFQLDEHEEVKGPSRQHFKVHSKCVIRLESNYGLEILIGRPIKSLISTFKKEFIFYL